MDLRGDARILSTLHENNIYLQGDIDKEGKENPEFASHYGLFDFLRMQFGLNNAPGIVWRGMDVIILRNECLVTLVYLDTIGIFSKSLKGRIKLVQLVLMLLQNSSVTMKLKKSELFSNAMKDLGHFIHPGWLAVSQHTINAIRDLTHNEAYYKCIIGHVLEQRIPTLWAWLAVSCSADTLKMWTFELTNLDTLHED